MARTNCLALGALVAWPCLLTAQKTPPPEVCRFQTTALRWVIQEPPGHEADRWVPLLMVFPGAVGVESAMATVEGVGKALVSAGFVVVSPIREECQDVAVLRH